MLKSNIDVFFVTSFLYSLKFLLFYRIVFIVSVDREYKEVSTENILKIFCGSVFVI